MAFKTNSPRAYLKGGSLGGSIPPRNFQIFLKSEGKEVERNKKKENGFGVEGVVGGGGGGLIVNIFLGLRIFRVRLRYFQGGLRNFRRVEKFSGG